MPCRSFPTQFRHSLSVALDVTSKQRLQTIQSAWPNELLCQLTCNHQSQSQSKLQPLSRLVATAQHPQSLPSPRPSSRPSGSGESTSPPKSQPHRSPCNTSTLGGHLFQRIAFLLSVCVDQASRRPHPASRLKLRPNDPFTGLASPVSARNLHTIIWTRSFNTPQCLP